ncbi:MAG: hypothetical protein IKH90_02120 [Ruminococcus sp.]|nr:hypothetical protein [Ruminococcus sp.]
MVALIEKIRTLMKRSGDRTELTIDILCLLASYGLIFILPQKMNILFWIIFGVSAFLFCIGFFRMGAVIDRCKSKKVKRLSGILLILSGIVLNCSGVLAIWKTQSIERGICIATLLLIEAIVMYSTAASRAVTLRFQWIISLIFRIAAVPMAIGGIAAIVHSIIASFSGTNIAIGVLLLVESIVFWAIGSGNDPFNQSLSPVRVVPNMNKTVRELCDALADTETQLGFPWIGKVNTSQEETIIYGPTEENVFVYGHYHSGRFYIVSGDDISLLDAEQADAHRIAEIPDSKGRSIDTELLPEAYSNMITRYLESGKVIWSIKLNKRKE